MKLVSNLNHHDLNQDEQDHEQDFNLDETIISGDSYSRSFDLNSDLGSNGHMVYKEMSDLPIQSISELERLAENVKVLGELSSRLNFLLNEVSYLIHIKKY